MRGHSGTLSLVLIGGLAHSAVAQTVSPASSSDSWAANVIVPQCRAFAVGKTGEANITSVDVNVTAVGPMAATTLDVHLSNPTGRRIEAEMLVPVPDGAVVKGFAFEGAAGEPTAKLLPADQARRLYEAIVAKVRDPALLEFAGYNMIRSSVFPIEAGQTQTVRLVYEHVLPAEGNRVDYILPRSESLSGRLPWNITVEIKSPKPISTVYSPSHPIQTRRVSPDSMIVHVEPSAAANPGPFRLSYLLEEGPMSASLWAYPDAQSGGGYFLMMAGLPAKPPTPDEPSGIKREVTLVIDRSGSMQGEKIDQVREAAKQVVGGLNAGESFNILIYNETVSSFAQAPVVKTPDVVPEAFSFLSGITATGGTSLHDALVEALKPRPAEGFLPIVLFMTDGLPTVGNTSEVAIRDVATQANPYERRVFTFGVGVDVNTPLLQTVAERTRAAATFVLPGENVEMRVSQVFKRLSGPILASPELDVVYPASSALTRVFDMIPDRLPDLFEGDQLVLLGRYRGQEPLRFRLSGNFAGNPKTFEFSFDLDKATVRNSFVPRLWATRRIAVLVDAIRQMGADDGAATGSTMNRAALQPVSSTAVDFKAPKVKELVDEIIRLSTEYGVLTEYTAFLAREGVDLKDETVVWAETARNLQERAVTIRCGLTSVNQTLNTQAQVAQGCLNYSNSFYDANMNRVEIATIQQINDRAFFHRQGRWVDSRLINRMEEDTPRRVIEFGSEDFKQLVSRLAGQGRQGCVALKGDIVLEVDGQPVLIKAPTAPESPADQPPTPEPSQGPEAPTTPRP